MTRSKKLSALIVVLALGLLGCGAAMTVAGIAAYRAEAFMAAWEKNADEPEAQAWRAAHAAAEQAVAMYPVANGDYLDRLGRVHSWQDFRKPFGDRQADASRQAALAAYRAAINARPSWPFTQARLVHTKLYLLQFDDEFDRALKQAVATGAWRIGVSRELGEVGLLAWPSLTAAQREVALQQAVRAAAHSPREMKHMLDVAAHAGLTATLCQQLGATLKARHNICR